MTVIGIVTKKIRKTISRHHMINEGDRIIVAVSGGPDSVCLLDVLHRLQDDLNISLMVAHYDHGLRPGEDEAETLFVRELAASMALPFKYEKGRILTEKGGISLEERARDARYGFLEGLSRRLGAGKIAVGHNLNDQAETVIMRLLRGSGPSGLAGIPPVRDGKIIRPLIELSRDEVLSFLKERNMRFIMDSSNQHTGFLRNDLRLNLMPLLLGYQPRLIEHLGQLADMLRDEDRFMEDEAEKWLKRKAGYAENGALRIPVTPLLELPQSLGNRVIRKLMATIRKDLRRIGYGHIRAVARLAGSNDPQGELHFPGKLRVKRVYEQLEFTAGDMIEPRNFHFLIHEPGTFHLHEIQRVLRLEIHENEKVKSFACPPHQAFLDAEKIRFPMVLRNFQPGDRFIPFGMAGHKKIKDFFIDLKVPSYTRALTPILLSRETPVWVCGFRIDDRFKVSPESKRIMKITLTSIP